MAQRDFPLVKKFGELVVQAVISIIGIQATRGIIALYFPSGELSFNDRGPLVVHGDSKEHIKKLIAALSERMIKNFGIEFTEHLFDGIYATMLVARGNDPELSDVLECVPDGFLEREKVKYLSKDELERRVLQRTKELQELNASLELKVVERTRELVAANKKLEEANHELERLSNAKTEFLSLVSHQLRVPLTAVRWSIATLKEMLEPVLKKEHEVLFEKVITNNDRMVRLINNLLNIARIEEGRFLYQFQKISLGDVVADAVHTLSEFARLKSVTINYINSKDVFNVRADKEKLYLAVENVLDNAIKYTREGKIVDITVQKDDSHFILKISDQGIGVSIEEQARIFDKFFRAKNAIASDANGSGLGLFIVKKIIEDHGGHIRFQSEEGKGTTFSIELPAAD